MSIMMESFTTHPLERRRGQQKMPQLKKAFVPASLDKLKTQKIAKVDSRVWVEHLSEAFHLAPSTSPADAVCKLRQQMSETEAKNKQMKQQLGDHDVLLYTVQDALDLGPEVGPARMTRALKKHFRITKDLNTRLAASQETIKGYESLMQVCMEMAEMSDDHSPRGVACTLRASWTRQQNTITELKKSIQDLKDGRSSSKSSDELPREMLKDLVGSMDVDVAGKDIPDIIVKINVAFKALKDDIDDLQTENHDLAIDLKEAQEERQTTDNIVSVLEVKVRDLETANDKQTSEFEDLLEQFKQAGDAVERLQTELDHTKVANRALVAKSKIENKETEVSSLEVKVQDLQSANDVQASELEELLESYEESTSMLVRIQKELEESEGQNQTLVAQIKIYERQEQNQEHEHGSQMKELLQRCQESSALAEVLHTELDKSNLEKENLVAQIKTLVQNERVQDPEQVFRLEDNVADLQREKNALDTRVKDLIQQCGRSSAMVDGLQIELAETKLEKRKLSSQIKTLEKNGLVPQDPTRVSQLKDQVAELDARLKNAERQRQTADNLVFDLEFKVRNLETANAKQACELEESRAAVRSLRSELNQFSQKRVTITAQVKETDFVFKDLQEVLADSMRKYDANSAQINAQHQPMESELDHISLMERKVADLQSVRGDLDRLDARLNDEAQHQSSWTKVDLSELSDDIIEQLLQWRLQKVQLAKKVKILVTEREAMITHHEAELRQLVLEKEKLTSYITTLISNRRESFAQMQQCRDEVAASKTRTRELTAKTQILQKEKDDLTFQLKILIEQSEESTSKLQQCATATARLEVLTRELTKQLKKTQLERDILEAQAASDDVPKLKTTLERLSSELKDSEEEIKITAQEKEDLIDESVLLKTKLERVFKELGDAIQKHQELGEELTSSAQEKKELETYNHQLKTKLDAVSHKLDDALQERQELDEQLKITSQQNGVLGDEYARLETKLAVASKELASSLQDYQELDEKLNITAQERKDLEDESVQLQTKLQNVWRELDNACRESQEIRDQTKIAAQQKEDLEDQFAQLKTKLVDVSKELDHARQEHQDREIIIDEKVKIASLQKEEFERDIALLKTKLDDVSKELDDARQANQELGKHQLVIDQHKEELEDETVQLKTQLEAVFKELDRARQEHQETQSALDTANAAVQKLECHLTEIKRDNEQLKEQLKDVDTSLIETKSAQEATSAAAQRLESQLVKIQSEKDQLKNHLEGVEQERVELKEKFTFAQKKLNSKQAFIEDMKLGKKSLQEKLIQREKKIEMLEQEVQELEINLETVLEVPNLEDQNTQLQQEIQVLLENKKNLLHENENLSCENVQLKAKLEDISSELEAARQEHQKLDKSQKVAAKRKEDLKKESAQWKTKLENISKELVDARQAHKELENSNRISAEEKDGLKTEIGQLKSKLKDVSKEADNARQKHQELLESSNVAASRYEDLEKDQAQMKTELDGLYEELDYTRQEFQGLEANHTVILEDLEKKEVFIEEIENRNEQLAKQNQELQNKVDMLKNRLPAIPEMPEIEDQFTELNDDLEEMVEVLKYAVEQRDANKALVADLKVDLEEVYTDLKGARQEQQVTEDMHMAALTALEEKENLVDELEDELQELKDDYKELEDDKKEMEDDLNGMKEENKKLTDENEKMMDDKLKIEFQNKINEKKVASALALADDYKDDLAEMKVETKELDKQLDLRQKKIEELQEQLSEGKELTGGQETKISDLEAQNQKLAGEAQEFGTRMTRVLALSDNHKSEKRGLEKQLDFTQKKVKELQTKVKDLEAQNQELTQESQTMTESLKSAAAQFGLLSKTGDQVIIGALCKAFEDMKQRCAKMESEVADLKKTRAKLNEMVANKASVVVKGDSTENNQSASDQEVGVLKENIEDLRFKIFKQERMIKGLRVNVSTYHKTLLKDKDSIFDDMSHVQRAVVERLGMSTDIASIPAGDIMPWDDKDRDASSHQIGKGAFGKVFLRRYQDQAVAVKVPYVKCDSNSQSDEELDAQTRSNRTRNTMEALVHLVLAADHQSFPKFCGIVDFEGVPSLVLEFLGDKKTGEVFTLSHAIKYKTPQISRENWLDIIADLTLGVKAMHEQGLLHNDLKGNNVLLQFDKEAGRWRAHIIDMGKVSTFTMPIKHTKVPKNELEAYKDGVLYQHLAPEYILDLEPTSVHTDIYSLGMLLSRIEVLIRNSSLRELAASMTERKPRLRPSWKKVERAISNAKKQT